MIKWEYCQTIEVGSEGYKAILYTPEGGQVIASHPHNLTALVSQLGRQGWEMVNVQSRCEYVFKRKVS